MAKSNLVIVESPAKAKTIGKYLGKDYEVTASMGHIRDLPASQLGIDIEHDYAPQYISIKGKEKLIKELKSKAKHSDGVLLATDPDREGEAISWHLANILGLDPHEPNRVTFDEITKKGVKEGMAHPRAINEDLFNAQQARRVLDRLVGYKLSPFLWRKVRRGLSAGRVQSVAVRIIDDREKEIEAFKPELLINAATVKYTIPAFESVLPHIPESCIISDIASVKTGLPEFYKKAKRPFVSTHPMFGPTFANLGSLSEENAIIITESDHLGKVFFKDLYSRLHLNIFEYTFKQHDETIAYSLSIPFVSTMVFAATMKHQDAPGTTFKRHMNIARGLFSEDDYLLTEILFNPHTGEQLEKIQEQLSTLQNIIKQKDSTGMKKYLTQLRENIK